MTTFYCDSYDVAVIGAGHAGIEAALASARLGCRTICFTINLDWIGNMPCNPSIGGTSKGHLVREIDALGGQMGISADETSIQSRMLNLGKGAAVHSPRAQIDRRRYSEKMKHCMESQKGLDLKQGEVLSIDRSDEGFWLLTTNFGAVYQAKAVVFATGTFLRGKIFVGDCSYESGPDGNFPAGSLSDSLSRYVSLRRFKTGTPARVNKNTVDFSEMEEQEGDAFPIPFSFRDAPPPENKISCYITYTNEKTKQIILRNLSRSPLFGGEIKGVGPRYCPSIEDKIVRFAERERHQVFIEPCGLYTDELYLQGLSSSLPEDVQLDFIHSIPGLENCHVMRAAYAIEYDCLDPLDLKPSLEFKSAEGLFGAGQLNGSSGYEEAAAQGLIAGINAARKVQGKPPVLLDRAGSYIGTLIDDLVTKGCNEPYRMMTSRSEYRLLLRQDNADIRLTELGHEIGLISEERYQSFLEKCEKIRKEKKRVEKTLIPCSEELNRLLVSRETSPMEKGCRLIELLKRPQLDYACLTPFDTTRPDLPREIFEQVEIDIKYEGYIRRQKAQVAEMRRLEGKLIPEDFDYSQMVNLRIEAREKLSLIRPRSVGQASRVSGVSPADISVLLIELAKMEAEKRDLPSKEKKA